MRQLNISTVNQFLIMIEKFRTANTVIKINFSNAKRRNRKKVSKVITGIRENEAKRANPLAPW